MTVAECAFWRCSNTSSQDHMPYQNCMAEKVMAEMKAHHIHASFYNRDAFKNVWLGKIMWLNNTHTYRCPSLFLLGYKPLQPISILNTAGICSIVVLVYVNIEKCTVKDTKLVYIFRAIPWLDLVWLDVALAASLGDFYRLQGFRALLHITIVVVFIMYIKLVVNSS